MTSDQKKTPGIFFIIKWVGVSFIVVIFLYIAGMLFFQFGIIDDYDFPVWIVWGGIGMLIIAQSIILRLENYPSKFWFIIGLGILGIGAILTLGSLWVPNLDLYMIVVFFIFPVIQGGFFVVHLRRKGDLVIWRNYRNCYSDISFRTVIFVSICDDTKWV